jgi:tetrahydromethanopterin S-methyltransferase subunit G
VHAHPLDARIAHLEGAFDQVNERLGSIDRRFDSFEQRFDQVDRRFNWVIGMILGAWVTLMATQITTVLTILFRR